MKTARQIVLTNLSNDEYSADFDKIEQCMREYAQQALDEAAGKAEADLNLLNDDIAMDLRYYRTGQDYEVAVNRQSILKLKEKLK